MTGRRGDTDTDAETRGRGDAERGRSAAASCLDGLTPRDIFARLSDHRDVFWLDSGDSEGWSYLGLRPKKTICARSPADVRRALKVLGSSKKQSQRKDKGPPFRGGWIGFIGYEALGPMVPLAQPAGFLAGLASAECDRHWQAPAQRRGRVPVAPPAGATIPLLCFSYFSELLAYRAGEWWAVGPEVVPLAQPAGFLAGLASANSHRASGTGKRPQKGAGACQWHHAKSNFTRTAYVAAVDRALEYIAAGDIYQVNLAQRFTVPWEESAAELYLRLREQSPSDYGAFLGSALCGGAHTICSISPELFLNVNGETIITRPIKGTRPRGSASEAGRGAAGDAAGRDARARADCAARRSLERSEKERAELNMIVDLERNDLGHVCEYGSVRVVSPGEVETLPTLFHRVATIEGKLRASWTLSELLAATFPGGSVTGAPKIRAMQIISELERGARGPYCGAIGWLGGDRSLELSIAIRTAIVDERRKEVSYHAGSGIVADSVPQQEYEETLHKTAAFFRATAGFRVQGSGFGARRFSAKRNRQA